MSGRAVELRELLHRAVDLLCDELDERRAPTRRLPREEVHQVDEVSRAFAEKELKRRGWSVR